MRNACVVASTNLFAAKKLLSEVSQQIDAGLERLKNNDTTGYIHEMAGVDRQLLDAITIKDAADRSLRNEFVLNKT